MENEQIHKPVLLKEIIEYLNLKPGDKFVDATLNGGGHALAIAEKITPDGMVLGLEWDSDILKEFELRIKNYELRKNFILVNDSYTNLENVVCEYNFRPNGILFDLGLSSWHYEKSGRGFSFKRDEILDMRFNPKTSILTAVDLVNTYSKEELEKILNEYGEEQFAKNIATNIVLARKVEPIMRTFQLVGVIKNSVPAWYQRRKIHFATKTFQALRVAVNKELENVEIGVSAAISVLVSGGRLCVISFQGLEDKIVRETFKQKAKEGIVKFVVKGTVKPSWEEIKNNLRARSAKLKIVEKL